MQTLKIISNSCLPAFLCKALANYTSSMIRIRLNNCTIFWKQREFLHSFDNLQKLVSVGAIHRFIFNFSSIIVVIAVNSFVVFTKLPSIERYLANFFSPVFLWTFRNSLSASARESKLSEAVDIKTLRDK